MFCNMCGNVLVDDAKFCNICGTKVISLEPMVMTEEQEPQMSITKQAVLIAGAAVVGSILAGGILLFTISLIAYL